jgi:hypothetical protein
MELAITIGQIFLLSIPLGLAGAWMAVRGPSAWAVYIRGHREDPWPVGVQEEYPDHHWAIWSDETAGVGTGPTADRRAEPTVSAPAGSMPGPFIEDGAPAIPLVQVRSTIRRPG